MLSKGNSLICKALAVGFVAVGMAMGKAATPPAAAPAKAYAFLEAKIPLIPLS